MKGRIAEQYDNLYASKDNVFNDGLPQKAAMYIPQYLLSGTVLDVGAGEGQNALYLAKKGFVVTAIDLSQVGLNKIKAAAEIERLQLKTCVADIEHYQHQDKFAAHLFSFVLHHLNTENAIRVLETAKRQTLPGGIHVIATFANQGGLYERAKKSGRFYPSVETLEKLYDDWEILEKDIFERASLAKDKQGNHLINETILLVARKIQKTP